MEQSVKDKQIILGFVGFAILLISSIATLIVAEKFNQDNFGRLIVFVCSNLLGWLLYLSSRQSSSTHTKSTESSSARKRHLPKLQKFGKTSPKMHTSL